MFSINHIVTVGIVSTVLYSTSMIGDIVDSKSRIETHRFSMEKVKELLEEKKIVFVKVGADWCKYCIINDRYFKNPKVVKFFKDNNIVIADADITNRNYEAEEFLNSFNRMGIPFYVLYVPGIEKPIIIKTDIRNPDVLIQRLKVNITPKKDKSENKD